MKHRLAWFASALVLSGMASCGDDFPEKEPTSGGNPPLPTSSGTGAAGGSGGGGVDCGNGIVNDGEDCDGRELDGATCTSAGAFVGGALACKDACTFDTSGCLGPPASPRLRAPLNHAYVGSVHVAGSLRPAFRWDEVEVAGVTDPVRYELIVASDEALGDIVSEMDVDATTFQPDADLPVSEVVPVGAAYWWSVRACVGEVCSAPAKPWLVRVGRQRQDVNGDGYADAASGSKVVFGQGDGFGGVVTLESNTTFVGDLDNDGFGDVVTYTFDDTVGVWYGAPGGNIATQTPTVISKPSTNGTFGYTAAGVGDVNGDAYDDLVVGDPFEDTGGLNAGAAYVYFGGPAPFDTTEAVFYNGLAGDALGCSIAGADFDNDGYSDVLIGARYDDDAPGAGAGKVSIHRGGPGGPGAVADATLVGENDGDWFGDRVSAVGDLDGDGYVDIAVGARRYVDIGRVYVYGGGPDVSALALGRTFDGMGVADQFGVTVSEGCDHDGDGRDDFLIGAPQESASNWGRFYRVRGASSLAGLSMEPSVTGGPSDYLGSGVSMLGDLNGDNACDAIIGAPGVKDGTSQTIGQVYLDLGGDSVLQGDDIFDGQASSQVGAHVD